MNDKMDEILNELKTIRTELDYIKRHMPDKDSFLSSEEEHLLRASYEEEKDGKTLSHEEMKKELGL